MILSGSPGAGGVAEQPLEERVSNDKTGWSSLRTLVPTDPEEIERLLERVLLVENYDRLTEKSGQLCVALSVNYVNRTPSVREKDLLFVKRLTKVGHHILEKGGNPPAFAEKLYQFNKEGVRIVGDLRLIPLEERRSIYFEKNLVVFESHLLAHAGYAARVRYNLARHISSLEDSFNADYEAAKISAGSEPDFSAMTSLFAAKTASLLLDHARFHRTSKKTAYWAKKGIECYRRFLDYCEAHPERQSRAMTDGAKSKLIDLKIRSGDSYRRGWSPR